MQRRFISTTSRLCQISAPYAKTWDPSASLPNVVDLKRVGIQKPATYSNGAWNVSCQSKDHLPDFLRPGEILKLVSWNIDFAEIGRERRAHAAIDLIGQLFERENMSGHKPIILLQEVDEQSLSGVLKHPWVQKYFSISDTTPTARYFTMILVPKSLATATPFFRIPYPDTKMERDLLGVDIPIIGDTGGDKVLRIGTTHLESLYDPHKLRLKQLELVSQILKSPGSKPTVAAGILGGDMNASGKDEHVFHLNAGVDLRDVWENVPPPITHLKPFEHDLTYGRGRGNTFGYHPRINNLKRYTSNRHRLDKFMYAGNVQAVKLDDDELDFTGKIGRFGIHAKTSIRAMHVEMPLPAFDSRTNNYSLVTDGPSTEFPLITGKWKDTDVYISDHFGIAVGFKVSA